MRIIVVGANGYIARNLIKKLVIQHEVYSFVRNKPHSKLNESQVYETKNLSEMRSNITRIHPELIINLASTYSPQHKYEEIKMLLDTEIGLSVNLAEICCELGIYLMQTKSLFQNSTKGSGINLYAASKNGRDQLMQYFVAFKHLKLINLLLGDVYGCDDNRNKLIPAVISHLRSENRSNFCLENPMRKFYPVFLEDVLAIVDILLSKIETKEIQSGEIQCFELEGMTLNEFVEEVQKIVSKSKFQVSWLIPNVDFRDAELIIPEDLLNIRSEFTPLQLGFRHVLNI